MAAAAGMHRLDSEGACDRNCAKKAPVCERAEVLGSAGLDELWRVVPQRLQSPGRASVRGTASSPDFEANTQWLEPRFRRSLEGLTRAHFGTDSETLASATRADPDAVFCSRLGCLKFEVSSGEVGAHRFHRVASRR